MNHEMLGDEMVEVTPTGATGQPASGTISVRADALAALAIRTRGHFTATGEDDVDVLCEGVHAGSVIVMSLASVKGRVGAHPKIVKIEPGIGFTVEASEDDGSTYNFVVF